MQAQLSMAVGVSLAAQMRRRLFGLAPDEASFARRGFHAKDETARRRLEDVGRTFLVGYQAALEEDEADALARRLAQVPCETRGFAFEGAAMALSLLDLITPWKRDRWQSFTAGVGDPHIYMMHVGRGWALARLRWPVGRHLKRLDPLLGWLAVDGYGFHEGYFKWRRYVDGHALPPRLKNYERRVFDQGLGRSIWFVRGADAAAVVETLRGFEPARRPDLWSGVGLACTYAGGANREAMELLLAAAGEHRQQLAQGAAFAAKTRERAGNLNANTEEACRVFCGRTATEAAAVTDLALVGLSDAGPLPSYEVWRRRIQAELTQEVAAV
jgi:enediyne biosynthesis protein E3